ncbi:tyrosine-type recombinase/integrase [Rosistilla ulvae]|uniref:tyrosine-type recombinase/integrase n=1 Tax=Rosistilla ulvae TaxID=1930277 RepID=UPI003704703F
MSKRSAETIFRHVSELIRTAETGLRLDSATEIWANELSGKLRDKLLKLEILTGNTRSCTDADKLLEPFLQRFIDNMVDAAANTQKNYLQTKQWLTGFLGNSTRLIDITPADLDRWHRHMKAEGLALSNRNKHIQRARKFFQSAVDDRLLSESPATKLTQERPPKGMRVDRTRQFFVDAAMTARVLEGLPDGDITLTFAMARFIGLRRCEVYSATWDWIDWERSRLLIDSLKTGYRECPMFEAEPFLRAAYQNAPKGPGRIIQHFSDAASMTTLMRKHIERVVGVGNCWPKTLQQLRSTRRTELEELYPNHAINEWLGHDGKTAEAHYLQVTPEHWERAKQNTANGAESSPKDENPPNKERRGNTGGNIDAISQAFTAIEVQKNPVFLATDSSKTLGKLHEVPRRGVEPLLPP